MSFSKVFLAKSPTLKDKLSSWISPKKFSINQEVMSSLLPEHQHDAARRLPESLKRFRLQKEEVRLYYPGCGQDLVWPMITLNSIAPDAMEWTIIGQDLHDVLGALICAMQELTGEKTYFNIKSNGVKGARFRFKDKTVNLFFSQGNSLSDIPVIAMKGYDLYFERGFEIMRNQSSDFFGEAISFLRKGGLALIDAPIPKIAGLKKATKAMPEWGFYKEPAVYIKSSGAVGQKTVGPTQ